MSSADLLNEFGGATLALSVAVALAFLLSRRLRPRFGAGVAYATWWLVPAALLAVLLPAPVAEMPVVVMPTTMPVAAVTTVTMPTVPFDPAPWLAALWLLGALAMALRLWRLQHRFERDLGRLRPLRDGLWQAQTSKGLPALLGVVRARIVLPDDFRQRYDARERHLMLAHERTHRRRGDHLANFAVAALRCLFWFNPLVHLAARSFRHDQELACDQAVIAAHPDSRRAYGEAMLKTLMADRQAPLGCHWGFSHPLKERVMQLKSPMPRPLARRIGATTVALLALGTGFAVWSAQPTRAPRAAANAATATTTATNAEAADVYHVVFDLKSDDTPAARFEAGGLFGSRFDLKHRDGRGNEILVGGNIRRVGADRFDVALELKRNGAVVAKPRLIVARDEPGAVKIGEEGVDGRFQGIELSMRVDDRGTPAHIQNMVNAPAPVAAVAPAAAPAPPAPVAKPAPVARPSVPTPVAAVAPAAVPALPAPVAAPAPVAPRAPKSPVAPPSPPDAPAPPLTVRPAERAQLAARYAGQAEKARSEAVEAQAAASRHAAQPNPDFEAGRATAREAARAAAAAKEAQQAARAAEAVAFTVDPETAERARARYATMSPQEIEAELEAARQRIEKRRGELRAMAAEQAAREAARAPTPAPTAR
jgi:bla regulator protein BlaR1